MKKRYLIVLLSCFIFGSVNGQSDWQKIRTVEEVYAAYPTQIKSIFLNLNLSRPGLEEVKKAWENNDIPLACRNLLTYYGKSAQIQKELPAATQETVSAADSALQDIFTFQQVTGKVPRLTDGHLKWDCMGPASDIEWAWALNRHYPTGNILSAFLKTGNPKYASYIDSFTKDWIISSWPYPAVKSGTAMWRGLEVSFRVKTWSKVFYELWNTDLISPATKLLILSSIPQHAHYARNFHAQGNWLTMEISGLSTATSSWPEFKESGAYMEYAIKTMSASMKEQVYPDGVQTELTSSYHLVALSNFNLFANICQKNNVPLPPYYTKTLEDMWNYLALIMRPDGFGVLNNDADLINNRESIMKEGLKYNHPDWIYIASNGKSGSKPKTGPSNFFPYAGQLISRSDYGKDAQWSFFDIGPWGTGHQHNDKLHLSVYAYGRDLLVDGGRFAYRGEVADKFRKYATGSFSHNTILVDGKGQAGGPTSVKVPLSDILFATSKDFDYGSGTFNKFSGLEGLFSQTRSMVYVRSKFWVVADRLKTDRPRNIETLWHWHPGCKVEIGKSAKVFTTNDRGNLLILPVDASEWKISLVKGQEQPSIQGWYSKEYNTFEPNPTAIFNCQLKSDDTFVWILWPSEGKIPEIQASILSKSNESVKVLVTEPGKGSYEIELPYENSHVVGVKKINKK